MIGTMTVCLLSTGVFLWDIPQYFAKPQLFCSQAAQTFKETQKSILIVSVCCKLCLEMCKEYLSTQKAFHEKELDCWILCTQSLFLQVLHTCHFDCKNAFERRGTQPLQQQSIPHVFIPYCTSLSKQVSVLTGSILIGFT